MLGDDYGDDYGEVDMFGLDEFGQPVGMNPLWGAALGAGFQTGTAMAVRGLTDMDEWAEAIGAGVGLLGGGIMAFFPGSRAAGVTAMAVSLVSGGLRTLEQFISDKEKMKAETAKANAGTTGYGSVTIEPTHTVGGFGQVEIEPLSGGFGIATIEPSAQVAGLGQAPQLLGYLGQEQRAAQVQIEGGPMISGLGAHYGATIFGGN